MKHCPPLANWMLGFGVLGLFASFGFLGWGVDSIFYTTPLLKWVGRGMLAFAGTSALSWAAIPLAAWMAGRFNSKPSWTFTLWLSLLWLATACITALVVRSVIAEIHRRTLSPTGAEVGLCLISFVPLLAVLVVGRIARKSCKIPCP